MYLTRNVIDKSLFEAASSGAQDEAISGAVVSFLGMVRNHSNGRKVLYLEYEAYETMAEN